MKFLNLLQYIIKLAKKPAKAASAICIIPAEPGSKYAYELLISAKDIAIDLPNLEINF